MSTHNIGYEDLTKFIFQLSSNMHLISSSVSLSVLQHICLESMLGLMEAYEDK